MQSTHERDTTPSPIKVARHYSGTLIYVAVVVTAILIIQLTNIRFS